MNKADERAAFLAALANNEDDAVTRSIFADWLDDHDEPEEADRQRKWPAAKAWLMEFCLSINDDEYAKDENGQEMWSQPPIGKKPDRPHSYKDMIEAGHGAVAREGYYFGNEDGRHAFFDGSGTRQEFFRNWSIVTGVSVPEEVIESPGFSCAC